MKLTQTMLHATNKGNHAVIRSVVLRTCFSGLLLLVACDTHAHQPMTKTGSTVVVRRPPSSQLDNHIPHLDKQKIIDLQYLVTIFHSPGSGAEFKTRFPDAISVFVDDPRDMVLNMPPSVNSAELLTLLPFTYYFSESAGVTGVICNQGRLIALCGGKKNNLICRSDINSNWDPSGNRGGCKLADFYKSDDPRLNNGAQ